MWLAALTGALLTMQAAPAETLVPKGTEIFLTMGRSVSTATALRTDRFFATVAVPVVIGEEIAIPAGTHVLGEVERASEGGRLSGTAELKLRWESMILPSGQTLRITAVTDSADGHASADIEESAGTLEGGGKSIETVDPEAAAERIGRVAASPTAAAATAGATLGEGALVALFSRAPDAVVEKGAMVTIELVQAIRLRPEGAQQPPDA